MPESYTDKKFREIVEKTGLGSSTIKGLYEHLVNGLKNVDASERAGILPAQLTRGLRTFEEKVAELDQIKKEKQEEKLVANLDSATKAIYHKQALIKSNDVKEARDLVGNQVPFLDAELGNVYTGKIVYCGQANIFQECSSKFIIHDSGNLSKLPKVNELVDIEYSYNKKMATVKVHLEKEKTISR